MELRSVDEVRYLLREREQPMFGGESSDEGDLIEDQEIAKTEQECDEDESSSNGDSNIEPEESVPAPSKDRHKSFIYGKNKYKWNLNASESKDDQSETVDHFPGPLYETRDAHSPLEVWSLLFNDRMIETLVQHTNESIRTKMESINKKSYTSETTTTEMKAFIGLLYFAGIYKSAHINIAQLWSTEYGFTLLKAVMSSRRFEFLAARLRFDDKNTRGDRRKTDLLAPVRDLWNGFISNCTRYYTPYQAVTIDQQLLEFRGRFSARVYTKSKPHRYEIKIICINDAKTYYLFNAIPYVGRATTLLDESISSYYMHTLCEPIFGSNRNITCGSWFTSMEVVDKMLKEHSLTMVGMIKENEQHIPKSFTRKSSEGTVRYAYDGTKTLVSYSPEKHRVIMFLSSLHVKDKADPITGQPEIIEYYNKTKGATDCFHQLCNAYTCARTTMRWTLRFFMGMLDQAGVNSYILYNFVKENEILNRQNFLKQLVMQLVRPHMQQRLEKAGLNRQMRSNIREILGEGEEQIVREQVNRTDKLPKRKRCSLCSYKYDKKTFLCCIQCGTAVCDEHRRTICQTCYD